jgi:hypothetical protein
MSAILNPQGNQTNFKFNKICLELDVTVPKAGTTLYSQIVSIGNHTSLIYIRRFHNNC